MNVAARQQEMRDKAERVNVLKRMSLLRIRIERDENELERLQEGIDAGRAVRVSARKGPQKAFFTEAEIAELIGAPPRQRGKMIKARAELVGHSKGWCYRWLERWSPAWGQRNRESPVSLSRA